MFGHNKWIKHTALVPKGFIRHQVLEALNENPMSGSELMEEIEKRTGGFWKPSPGSIYPLLAWLQEKNHVKELPSENGLKRYELNKSGKELLAEQERIRSKFRQEMGFMPGQFFDTFLMKIPPEKISEIRVTMKHFADSMFHVAGNLRKRYSEKALTDALKIIEDASKKLEDINESLKGDNE